MPVLFWGMIALMTLAAIALVVWPLLRSEKPAKKTTLFLLFATPVVAVFLYMQWGSSKQLQQYWVLQHQARLVKAELKTIKSPKQIIDRLKAHLVQYPNSARGWYLLGKLYFGMRDYQQAYFALKRAHGLKPQDPQYSVGYAEAQFFRDHSRLNTTSIILLQRLVAKMPNNVAAVNLLAMNAYLEKRYQTAINNWEHLLGLFPPGSKDSQQLMRMIAKAQQKRSGRKASNVLKHPQV